MTTSQVEKIEVEQAKGEVRDSYDILDDICSAHTYHIKVGKHKTTDGPPSFAIKFIEASTAHEGGLYETLAMTQKLSHPNIIKMQELFEDANWVYVVYELCSGD